MKLNLPEYTKTKYWRKSYPKGFPSDVTIPRVGLSQLIEDAVKENHGRVAMLYGGEEITYDALGNQIGHFASALPSPTPFRPLSIRRRMNFCRWESPAK